MQIIISILAAIICIICVIAIHEFGHALAAKYFGVKIQKICIGFGPKLLSWKGKNDRTIDLCVFWLGGRVHLLNSRTTVVNEAEHQYCFDKQLIWKRTIILLAGSLANIVCAYLALVFMLMLGFNQLSPVIESVRPGSNAQQAGLQTNAKIVAVANKQTPYFRDVAMQLITHVGHDDVPIQYCKASKKCYSSTINLNVWENEANDFSFFSAIGFKPRGAEQNTIYIKGVPLLKALVDGFSQLVGLGCFFIVMLKQILSGNIPIASLIGPFRFFEAIIDSLSQGFATFLYFIGNFSLAMAIANLLPLPSLDGGSIIYGLIEKVRGKPMSVAFEVLIYKLVFILFAIFLVQLIVNDLKNYF